MTLTFDLQDVRSDLVQFEGILHSAICGTYYPHFPAEIADDMVKRDQLININLVDDFFDRYVACEVYPTERLGPLSYRIMDWKMQSYFVSKALPGLHNALFSRTKLNLTQPLQTPGLYLDHLCMMQAMIGQVRVLWDRLMGFIYFLEEGREPQGKSIRKAFFRELPNWEGRWDALANCQAKIDAYDTKYRTPEFHKNSVLRASIFKDEAADPNEIMGPAQGVVDGFWRLLQDNISGIRSNIFDVCPSGPIHHPNDSDSDVSPPANTGLC